MSLNEQWLALQKEIAASRLELVKVTPPGNTTRLAGTVEPFDVLQAHIETLENQANAIKQRMEEPAINNPIDGTAKLIWTGTKLELAGWILSGKIEATSDMNRIEQVISHVEMKDGSALKAKNLWQNRKNKEDYGSY
jgi:hypothetical protein